MPAVCERSVRQVNVKIRLEVKEIDIVGRESVLQMKQMKQTVNLLAHFIPATFASPSSYFRLSLTFSFRLPLNTVHVHVHALNAVESKSK